MLKDPGVKLHFIAVTQAESLATRAIDLTFASEVEEMGMIDMADEADEVGDIGEP